MGANEKLTRSQVIDIRRLYHSRKGEPGLVAGIAKKYKLARATIANIVTRRTYIHIPEELTNE